MMPPSVTINLTAFIGGIDRIMDFLLMLKEIRTPFLDNLFLAITFLGDETFFTAVVLLFLWCLNKRVGYFMFYTFMLGACTNQILKNVFCIPRPWVINPAIDPVECAIDNAGGYSFPSGHTQSAAGLFGSLAVAFRKAWVAVMGAAAVVLVGFSRMYLGVHTPADVAVSLATGLGVVILTAWLFGSMESRPWVKPASRIFGLGVAAFMLLHAWLLPTFDDVSVRYLTNASKAGGAMSAMILVWWLDDSYIRYGIQGPWWWQALKYALGLGSTLALLILLKAPVGSLVGGHLPAYTVRYFLVILWAGAVYPLLFSRLAARLSLK